MSDNYIKDSAYLFNFFLILLLVVLVVVIIVLIVFQSFGFFLVLLWFEVSCIFFLV